MCLRLTLAIFLFVCAFHGRAIGQGYIDILPDKVKNPFIERHDRIEKDLAKSAESEWTGRYSRFIGETWSEFFVWSPENGFAAFRDTCSHGPRAWVNYGAASWQDGRFVVTPERAETAEYVLNLQATDFTAVKWGEQHWLIPTAELALFAYAINSQAWEDIEAFYIKTTDIEKPRKGQPDLPPKFKRLLGLPPVKAKVIDIGPAPENWYPEMTINAGKNKDIIEGMSFWLVGFKNIDVKVSVKAVVS